MNKNKIIAALAVIIFLDEAVIMPLNKKRVTRALKKQEDLITYLGKKLDDNGIELTEFDKIAMSTISKA